MLRLNLHESIFGAVLDRVDHVIAAIGFHGPVESRAFHDERIRVAQNKLQTLITP